MKSHHVAKPGNYPGYGYGHPGVHPGGGYPGYGYGHPGMGPGMVQTQQNNEDPDCPSADGNGYGHPAMGHPGMYENSTRLDKVSDQG